MNFLNDPKPGETWLVDFEPNRGAEMNKRRPAVVISEPGFTYLPLRIVVPVTDDKRRHLNLYWYVEVIADAKSGLSKPSEVDTAQCHSFDLDRFAKKLGSIRADELALIREAVAISLGL
ncbi:MAG TPA: type II toxin-antitoxin system PemK/MazF family toxin [Candidatus Kapabacteria bacterium]|nr:type II toxin-antitoxin system PemK/MazF family toxin [Candidatus Kapabacteria bacterium]